MRLKLILAFTFVVIVSVSTVLIAGRLGAAEAVRVYMFRGGMFGSEGFVDTLEQYYKTHDSWVGVENLFTQLGHMQGAGYGGQGTGLGMGGMRQQRIRLIEPNGKLIEDTNGNDDGFINPDELKNAIELIVDRKTVGYLLVEGGTTFTQADSSHLVSQINRAAITASLIGGGVSFLLALILAYSLIRPIRELKDAADSLAKGNLKKRVRIKGNDELAVLGRAFNQMAGGLQRAEISRKALTADIAHELRNPLAIQRANLEAMQDGVYELTHDNLKPILEQNELLTRLVEDLRTLALADEGNLLLERTSVDLSNLILKVCDNYKPQSAAKNIEIEVNNGNGKEINIFIDATRVEQILSNLLSNALRYTPKNGKIEVSLHWLEDIAHITVRDNGPGIPQESMPLVFDRFYRVERSRSRSGGGTGLGLAIARQLALAHGGSLEAANHPDGGAIFNLKLPNVMEHESK